MFVCVCVGGGERARRIVVFLRLIIKYGSHVFKIRAYIHDKAMFRDLKVKELNELGEKSQNYIFIHVLNVSKS